MAEPKHGCLVCSGDLAPRAVSGRTVCAVCDRTAPAAATCVAGHSVCDACQAGVARDVVERFCHATESPDPIEIALDLMRHPAVRLHGPEHRFVAAAALVTAHANARREQDHKERRLADARRAIEATAAKGCACDARKDGSVAHATGVYATVAGGTAALAAKLVGDAVKLVSQNGAGRATCCKRATFLSILQACHFTREHLATDLRASGPPCEWWRENRECIQDACPFYRPAAA